MRSSTTVLILISCFFVKFARSQSHELIIQGQTGNLYLEHTVVAKENWYSIGRLYNVSPKELAPFNHVTLAQPLAIGETLQIPLTATNFSQNGLKAVGETLIPVIHITQEKEWMYRISVNHNKVPIPSIEKWNNVTPDQIHPGMHLIVGYLKVKTALSALATNPPANATVSAQTNAPAATATAPAAATNAPATTPAATPSVPAATTTPKTTPSTPAQTTSRPATAINTDSPAASAPATAPVHATTSAPTTSAPATAPAAPAPRPVVTSPAATATSTPAPNFNGGVFRSDYKESGKSASGLAGVFKSTSGWQDGKYYALMNNVTVGTIVRITDPTSNKSVYAKILGQLPDMKESAGLTIRISNAAAAELGEGEARFNVQVNY
jgi:LysM repeat protein